METTLTLLDTLRTIGTSFGTLSTVNEEGNPQSAAMYFTFDDHLNLYFLMRSSSRKYKNLEKNPHGAFVTTSPNHPITIQFEGTVSRVTDPHEESELFTKLVALASASTDMPPVMQMDDSETVFMKMTPSWARTGNFEVMRSGDMFTEITNESIA